MVGEKTQLDEDIRCLHCGYSLQGLDRNRCPECGRYFDLSDQMTFDSPERRAEVRLRRLLSFVPLLAFISATGLSVALGGAVVVAASKAAEHLVLVWIASGVILISLLVRSRARKMILAGRADPDRRSERLWNICIAALAVGFLLSFTTVARTCPHGTAIGIGGVGIAWSDCGGPCRNDSPSLRSRQIAGDLYIWETF